MATSAHPAGDDRIFFKEARSLVKAGADVTVLCARGMTFPEETFGVCFQAYDGGGALSGRSLTTGALERAIAAGRYDVIHCHEPDSLIAALRVKRASGVKVIFDSHEMWGAVFAGRLPPVFWAAAERVYQGIEARYLRRCDAAVGASQAISRYLARSVGEDRVVTLLNVPVVDVFGEHQEKNWGGTTLICHDGVLSFDRGLKNMAEAVRRLAERQDVAFKIVGDVFNAERTWLKSFVARHGLEEIITCTGWLPYRDVGKAISPCHIGLVCTRPLPNNLIAAPNKCFNYLLYGLPFVAPAYRDSHFATLELEGCAVLADPTSPASYEHAIGGLLDNRERLQGMSARAISLSRRKYRWDHMEPVLFGLYEKVLGQAASS